jgi:hypothetical protein
MGTWKCSRDSISPSTTTVFRYLWAGIIVDYLRGSQILRARVNGHDCLQTHLTVLLEDVSFNTRLDMWFQHDGAHHITAVKCVSDCPKIILGAGLVRDMKLQFRGLHAHLAWNLLEFTLWVYMKIKFYASTFYTRGTVTSNSVVWKWNTEYFRSLQMLSCFSFTSIAELSVREHGGHLEHLLQESENEEVINSSFMYLYHYYRNHHVRSF